MSRSASDQGKVENRFSKRTRTPLEAFQLSLQLQGQGRILEAEVQARAGLGEAPTFALGHAILGDLLSAQERWLEAVESYRNAVELGPELVSAWNNQGSALRALSRYAEAEVSFRRVLKLDPACAPAWRNLGLSLVYMNRADEACRCFERACELAPENLDYAWTSARSLPIVYTDEAQKRHYRKRYADRLHGIRRLVDTYSHATALDAVDGIWDAFHFHYQGGEDRQVQALHGELIHAVLSKAYPEFMQPILRSRPSGRRVRVGFVSSMLRKHTITYLFGGWMEGLDPNIFECFGYQLDGQEDDTTSDLSRKMEHFRCLGSELSAVAGAIQKDELDVLIYPELGMNRHTLKLAALRLAPVQCVTWGHPVTTGLPAIDYFLSSTLMEPENGQQNYTEALVELPGLSVFLDPHTVAPSAKNREDFGLAESDVVYLIPQSLFKLQPEHDAFYARIAKRVEKARFVFIANAGAHASAGVVSTFGQRLESAFAEEGLHWREFVRLVPGQSEADFLALNACSDIFLDAPGWSGGRTTLDAVSVGLLPITWPGRLMRQRHTAAILHVLELSELVASSGQHYVELAVDLGQCSDLREQRSKTLKQNRSRLYRDSQVIEALSDFLCRVAG